MKELRRGAALAFALCAAFLTLVVAAPAHAQDAGPYGVTPGLAVGGVLASSGERVTIVPTAAVQGQVLSLQVSGGVGASQQANAGGLAFTGADIGTMVLIGLSAMAVGVVLTRRARAGTTQTD